MVLPHTLLTLTNEHCNDGSCMTHYQAPAEDRSRRYRMIKICNDCLALIGEQKEIGSIHSWTWNISGIRARLVSIMLGKGDPGNSSDGKTFEYMERMLSQRFDDL
jgi:hypothetical protein